MAKKFKRAEKRELSTRKKLGVLVILLLIVSGFTVAAYYGMGGGGNQGPEPDDQPRTDYGIAASTGMESANVGQISSSRALFGQLDSPVSLAKRLGGELFVMSNGATYLIFTEASEEDIKAKAAGEYIIYRIAGCDTGFDCLVEGPVNGTANFDVYILDRNSSFIPTGMVGLPSAMEPVVL